MAWKAFSVFAGLSVWWAIGMGVTNALSTTPNPIGAIIGLVGALIAGVATGSYIHDLPRARRSTTGTTSTPHAEPSDESTTASLTGRAPAATTGP